MNIGVGDTIKMTFGKSKVREVIVVNLFDFGFLNAANCMSVNLDGREYPVKIEVIKKQKDISEK